MSKTRSTKSIPVNKKKAVSPDQFKEPGTINHGRPPAPLQKVEYISFPGRCGIYQTTRH